MTAALRAVRPDNRLILPYWMTLWSGLCLALALTAGTVLQLQLSSDIAAVIASLMVVALVVFVAGRGLGAMLARRPVSVSRLNILLAAASLGSLVPAVCAPGLASWAHTTGAGGGVVWLTALALLSACLLFFGSVTRYALPLLALSRGRDGDIREHLSRCLLAGGAIGALLGGYGLLPHMRPEHVFMIISAATGLFAATAALRYPPGGR